MKYFILGALITLLTGCTSKTGKRDLEGVYHVFKDTSAKEVLVKLQFVKSIDGIQYGTLEGLPDTFSISSPLTYRVLDDSLKITYWGGEGRFTAVSDSIWKGTLTFRDKNFKVTLNRTVGKISNDLLATKELLPVPIGDRVQAAAWPSFKSDGSFYVVGWKNSEFMLVRPDGNDWKLTNIPYDTSKYLIRSIGLSSDEKRLIAHGDVVDDHLQSFGKSDLMMVYLENDTTIDRIEVLPESVNTSMWDNFPDFTENDDIIFSSWGEVTPLQIGKGDLFLARKEKEGYTVTALEGKINTVEADAGASMDDRGRFVLFHRNSDSYKDKIFISRYDSNRWSRGNQLPAPINVKHSGQYSPRIGPEGKYLYFVSHHRRIGELYRVPVRNIEDLAGYFGQGGE